MKLSLKRIGFILLIVLAPMILYGQKPSKQVRRAQKKYEKTEENKKKAYENAIKKSNKHKFDIQTKETQKRIKESRKEAKQNTKTRKDPFFVRPFKKKKAKKR